jgi:hypothetical protein
VDARERIQRARQTERPTPDPETLPPSENVREQMSVQNWMRNSLAPALGSIHSEITCLQRNQNNGLSEIQGQIAYLASAIKGSKQARQNERWAAAALCVTVALVAGVIGPRISEESQRLQRLGTAVEASWQAMSPKGRRQLEKLLGWTEPTEPAAR